MACRALRSLIISRLTNPTDVLRELQMQLDELRQIAIDVDFDNPDDVRIFSENLAYIKRYFETYNRLIERE